MRLLIVLQTKKWLRKSILILFSAIFSFSLSEKLEAKVLVITHGFNRPDFIEMQSKTLNKFLKDEYEFVVFNDANNEEMESQIRNECKRLGIRHLRIPQFIHDLPYLYRLPIENYQHNACRIANAVQYSLNTVGFDHEGYVLIMDSDLFLIREFCVGEYMRDITLAGIEQTRDNGISYLWNGFVLFDMNSLPDRKTINFNCGIIEDQPCDVGGYTYYYLKEHPDLNVKFIDTVYLSADHEISDREKKDESLCYLLKKNPNNVEFFLDYTFFHYRGGTNWDRKSDEYHQLKSSILSDFIDKIVNQ
jgi:hypothetical protein